LGELAAPYGKRALLIVGRSGVRWPEILKNLNAHGVEITEFRGNEEPAIATVDAGVKAAREDSCDMVIGLGGGSVIDTAKAVAAILTNGGQPLDYLEVIGKGQKITKSCAPMIAVPTTAGTGSEVTRNAVLYSPEHQVKVSLRSIKMLPNVALVDPELTYGLPRGVTAASGLDAFTQVLEPLVSNKPSPLVDAFCWDGLAAGASALTTLNTDLMDKPAREKMSVVSLYGGMALANSKLGAVHGIAGPFGGMYDAPHGAICARLLPAVYKINARVIQMRQPDNPVLKRFECIAHIVTGNPKASMDEGAAWLQRLVEDFNIPKLDDYGMIDAQIAPLIEKSMNSSSMKGNPIQLTEAEIRDILDLAR